MAGSWRVRPIPTLLVVLAAVVGLAGCTGGGDRDPVQASISVSPKAALVDGPVVVTVQGLPAGARTTLTARAGDADGITWSATAQFEADSAGTVSLDQPSLGGSYTGVNPMGLFTLMAPPPGWAPDLFLYPEAGYDVTLQASVDGRAAATVSVRRQVPSAVGVAEKQLRPAKGGIYGNLYLPKRTGGRRPAVLVFGGSGGGLTTSLAAALLAAHGYPSLALAYFKVPSLPQGLHDIPLEYFTGALEVLRAQPGVDPDHVLVAGESRGGEAALLLGASFPELVNGVIAGVPSSVVNPAPGPDASRPAWTLRGRPLPAVSPSDFGRPNPPGEARAVIPVERIGCPVLLACGEQDLIWPSGGYVDAITARLRAHRFAHPVTALRYRDAGHIIGGLAAYYVGMTEDALASFGGTVAGTQAAQDDAHAKLLAFLVSSNPGGMCGSAAMRRPGNCVTFARSVPPPEGVAHAPPGPPRPRPCRNQSGGHGGPVVGRQAGPCPPELQVPDGHRLVLSALGRGVQVYDCPAGAWVLREPAAAILRRERTVAIHYAGPTWQSVKDGSKVVATGARVAVPTPHPERDIPWLRLETTGTGPGLFGEVDFVQRLETRGGVAPTGVCQAGASLGVPYQATYNFWAPAGA